MAEGGHRIQAGVHGTLFLTARTLQQGLQRFAQIHRNHRHRGFLTAQAGIIAHIGSRQPQQIRMTVHCLEDTAQHQQEAGIILGL